MVIIRPVRPCSSVEEQVTFNHLVVSSNLTRVTREGLSAKAVLFVTRVAYWVAVEADLNELAQDQRPTVCARNYATMVGTNYDK